MNHYARELKLHHEAWMDELRRVRPQSEQSQISSQALELAVKDLLEGLPSEPPPAEPAEDPLSLDAAMTSIRRHTPPE